MKNCTGTCPDEVCKWVADACGTSVKKCDRLCPEPKCPVIVDLEKPEDETAWMHLCEGDIEFLVSEGPPPVPAGGYSNLFRFCF